jgi:hypothetical protein
MIKKGKVRRFIQIAKYAVSIAIVIYQSAQKIYRIKEKMRGRNQTKVTK